MTDTPTPTPTGSPMAGTANSNAKLTDEVNAVLTGPDREGGSSAHVKGPDPAEWGEEQLVPPPDVAATAVDPNVEVKGPDPAKWGTEEERLTAERERVDKHVAEAAAAGTTRTDPGLETQTIGSGDVASAGSVLGAVQPPT